jgi:tRNA pseudouridine55 synthase
VGAFSVDEAAPFDPQAPAPTLIAPADAAGRIFPTIRLDAEKSLALTQGKRPEVIAAEGGPQAVVDPEGRLVGLVSVSKGIARTIVNFPADEEKAN